MDEYEVTTDGETIVGPVTMDQLRRGLVAGKLPADAKARPIGTIEWIPIAVVIASAAAPAEASKPPSVPAQESGQKPRGLLIGLGVLAMAVSAGLFAALKFGGRATTSTSGASASPSSSGSAEDPEAAARKGFELFDAEKPDEKAAVKLWEPACEAGNELACVGMGMVHVFGLAGRPTDYGAGLKLIESGCTQGNQRACSVLGQILYNAWGTAKDVEKAKTVWQKSCDAGTGRACYFLGFTYRAPDGPPEWRNLDEGEALLRKSCRLGYRSGCDLVDKIDREQEIANLRRKVRVKWWGFEPDGTCQGKGLPAYRKDYEGGTFDENEKVAKYDGCVSPFQSRDDALRNTFCCPYERKK